MTLNKWYINFRISRNTLHFVAGKLGIDSIGQDTLKWKAVDVKKKKNKIVLYPYFVVSPDLRASALLSHTNEKWVFPKCAGAIDGPTFQFRHHHRGAHQMEPHLPYKSLESTLMGGSSDGLMGGSSDGLMTPLKDHVAYHGEQ